VVDGAGDSGLPKLYHQSPLGSCPFVHTPGIFPPPVSMASPTAPSAPSDTKMVCIYIQRPPARSGVASPFPGRRKEGGSICCGRSKHATIGSKNNSMPLCYIINRSKSIIFLLDYKLETAWRSVCTHRLSHDNRTIEADNMGLFSSPAGSRIGVSWLRRQQS
jgi:hypothetical protein